MSKKQKEKRIAIVYPSIYLATIPSLTNLIDLLHQRGHKIDVYTTITPSLNEFRKKACFYSAPDSFLINLFNLLRFYLSHLIKPYYLIFAIDQQGLIQANFFNKFSQIPLVYYSLEILFKGELKNPEALKLKEKEISLSQQAKYIIVQDKERAGLLAKENQIPLNKFIFIPNAPPAKKETKRTSYLHNKFSLKKNSRIALYAGSLYSWAGLDKVIRSIKLWPKNWLLVIHSRPGKTQTREISILKKLSPRKRVFFSLKPLKLSTYEKLVKAADIGLAFYFPIPGSSTAQKNIKHLGLSSGKIAYYLQSGLPLIINQEPSFSKIVEQEKCGLVIKDCSDVGRAIKKIDADYKKYSQNARRVFKKYFNFEKNFYKMMKKINLA